MRGAIVRRTRHSIANRGIATSLTDFWRRLRLLPSRLRLLIERMGVSRERERADNATRSAVHPFDRRYGVDTSGLIWGERIEATHRSRYWATGYYAVSPALLWSVLEKMNLDWAKFVFVDIGSGKGRALLLAQRYPFRYILGVEFSANFVEQSRLNLERCTASWRQCTSVEVIQADAADFPLPVEPLVLFLYNPFAQPVMKQFVEGLRASLRSHPRRIYIVYVNPELHDVLINAGFFVLLWEERFALDQEDLIEDYGGCNQEMVAVYRNL